MIKINLAKKRKQGTSTGIDLQSLSFGSLWGALRGNGESDGERKRIDLNSPLVKLMLGAAVIWLVDSTLNNYRAQEVRAIDGQLAQIEKERDSVLEKLKKIKGFEPIKKQLEEDEHAVRVKLEVVAQLLENRNTPSKIMMHIAQAIPQEVWLTTLAVNADNIKFSGGTPSHNQVSDFIRSLSGAAYFADVTLKGIQESTSAKGDLRFQSFDLDARRR